MPFKSLKQERWAHTPQGEKALGGPKKVSEWDQATDQSTLPGAAKLPTSFPNLPPHIHRVTTK